MSLIYGRIAEIPASYMMVNQLYGADTTFYKTYF